MTEMSQQKKNRFETFTSKCLGLENVEHSSPINNHLDIEATTCF